MALEKLWQPEQPSHLEPLEQQRVRHQLPEINEHI